MTAKEYLRQVRTVDKRIDSKLEQVERLKSLRERVTAVLSGMPRGGRNRDQLAEITCRIFELEKEINGDIDGLVDLKADVRRRIEAIQDDRYRMVLEYRYLCGYSWRKIASVMNYDERQVYRLHGRALQELKDVS